MGPGTTDVFDTANPIEYWTKNNQWPKEYFKPEGDMAYPRLARMKGSSSPTLRKLTPEDQDVPRESLFSHNIFQLVCQTIESCGEFRITRDIGCLIVPSAENLALHKKISGDNSLNCLAESVNELWANIPIVGPCPKSDYSVGFKRDAFTPEQLSKLQPYIGKYNERVYYKGTPYMLFPFLTCEVKSAFVVLDDVDRQNAHSTALAIRAVVELFKLKKRQKELHRQILAFSISHNHEEGCTVNFYCHLIRRCYFTEDDGKDKWITYKFIVSLYNDWAPTHLKRLHAFVETLSLDPNSEVSTRGDSNDTGETENQPPTLGSMPPPAEALNIGEVAMLKLQEEYEGILNEEDMSCAFMVLLDDINSRNFKIMKAGGARDKWLRKMIDNVKSGENKQ
ncbi:hypothetical protein RUND412_008133 [Rhizina undulata]